MTLNDTLTCVDENECLTPSSCSQVCVDTKGSYKCECAAGYQLMPNQRTCKLASKPRTRVSSLPPSSVHPAIPCMCNLHVL